MFIEQNGIIRFDAQNESETKLLKYIKRQNGWRSNRRFNDLKDNHDGTVTLFLNEGREVLISSHRLPEVLAGGRISVNKSKSGREYPQIRLNGESDFLHRQIKWKELSLYDGFQEETGYLIQVNHIDENPFNATDENLEVVTKNENLLKRSLNHSRGYQKIPNGKFQVVVSRKYIGLFDSAEEAREAYVQAVKAEMKRLEDIRINWLISKGKTDRDT